MRFFISIFFLFLLNTLSAQTDYNNRLEEKNNNNGLENFGSQVNGKIVRLEISSDTVGVGGIISVSIVIENASLKKAINPAFEGFLVDGPSTSTSMSMINGVTTNSSSYIYNLRAKNVGADRGGGRSCTPFPTYGRKCEF